MPFCGARVVQRPWQALEELHKSGIRRRRCGMDVEVEGVDAISSYLFRGLRSLSAIIGQLQWPSFAYQRSGPRSRCKDPQNEKHLIVRQLKPDLSIRSD